MNILDILNWKRRKTEKDKKNMDTAVNKIVHDKRNEFQQHLMKVEKVSRELDRKIDEAKRTKVRLNKLLTTTEIIYNSTGGYKQKGTRKNGR